MPGTVIGKLNENAREFQAGQSVGFGFRIGEQYYDRQSKTKEWTNYECAVFSNKQTVIDAFRSRLVQGAVVCVSYKTQQIKSFDGQNGQVLSIGLNDCDIVRIVDAAGAAPAQQAYQQGNFTPPAPQASVQQAPATQNNGFRPDHPSNTGAAQPVASATVQPVAASPSNQMNSYDDDIPF